MSEKKKKTEKVIIISLILLLLFLSFGVGLFLGKNDRNNNFKSSNEKIIRNEISNPNIASNEVENDFDSNVNNYINDDEYKEYLKNIEQFKKYLQDLESGKLDHFIDDENFKNYLENLDKFKKYLKDLDEDNLVNYKNDKNFKNYLQHLEEFNKYLENLEAEKEKSNETGELYNLYTEKKEKSDEINKIESEIQISDDKEENSKILDKEINSEKNINKSVKQRTGENLSVVENKIEKKQIADKENNTNKKNEKLDTKSTAEEISVTDKITEKTQSFEIKSSIEEKNENTETQKSNDNKQKIEQDENSSKDKEIFDEKSVADSLISSEIIENADSESSKRLNSKNINESSIEENDELISSNVSKGKQTNIESKNKKENTSSKTIVMQSSDSLDENAFVSTSADTEKKDIEMLNKQMEVIADSGENTSTSDEEDGLVNESIQEKRIKTIQEIESELIKNNDAYRDIIAEIDKEIEKGKKALADGNINEAMSYFEKADLLVNDFVQENEDVPNSFASLKETEIASELLNNSKNSLVYDSNNINKLLEHSEKFAEKAVEKDESNADAFFILAQKYEIDGNYEDEIEELLNAVENDSDNYLYYFQLGKTQYRINQFGEAQLSFKKSIELKDDFYPSWFDLGLTLKKNGDFEESGKSFHRTLKLNENHLKSFFELAQISVIKSDYEIAEINYKKVLEIDSNNIQALLLLGTLCKIENKLIDAEEYFKRCIPLLKSQSELLLAKYNLSKVLLAEFKTDEAEKYAKESYQNVRNSNIVEKEFREDIYYNYAFILEENGKSEDSITVYSELLKINPDHERTKNNLAVMMMKLDPPDTDNALELVYSVYKKNKNNFEATNNIGTILYKMEEYEKAVNFYRDAIALEPEISVVRNNLAKTYSAMGKIDLAKQVLIESLKLNENNYQAYIELARISFDEGDDLAAKKYLIQLQQKNSLYGIDKIEEILNSFEKNSN